MKLLAGAAEGGRVGCRLLRSAQVPALCHAKHVLLKHFGPAPLYTVKVGIAISVSKLHFMRLSGFLGGMLIKRGFVILLQRVCGLLLF